ncbi:hypothetical protein [Aureimonas sp. AU22]|uniref:hypothetical protein n=1 Tax=Aureimonas sp. AU22 TaxID=1638162 RepID=UPI000A7AD590|nr:hypothetical protein [Aureimonas sp. AU22]
MTDGNCNIVDSEVRENLEALARLCEYVAREAVILNVPEAERLGTAVSDRIEKLLRVLN